jgi:outer membrane protein
MDKTSFRMIALLLPLLAPPINAQNNDKPSMPQSDGTLEQATPTRLPNSPFARQDYVLPSNPNAGIMPVPHVQIVQDHEYTLPELIDIGERENPETRVAWETARNAAVSTGIATSTYVPIVTANVLGGYQGVSGQSNSVGLGIHNSGNVFGSVEAVSLEWLLFDFGGRKNIVDASRKLSYSSNVAFTAAHQQVIYAVSIAYYAYLAALQRHRTSVSALANTRNVEAAAAARYDHGEGTVTETAQAREFTAESQLSVVTTQGSEQDAYVTLLAAIGISPLATIRIAPVERHPLSTDDLAPVDQIIRDALARRPDVLSAYIAVEAGQASVRATQAQNRPKIFMAGTGAYVSGQLGLTAIPSIGEQLPTLNISGNQWNGTVLLGVSIPIFDAHRKADAIRQAKNDVDKLTASLDLVRLNAMREIVFARNALQTSLAANDAAVVLKSTAQTSYDAALDSYKQGIGTVTAVVDAETHLFNAELVEDDAYTSALSAAVTLAFTTGALGKAPGN